MPSRHRPFRARTLSRPAAALSGSALLVLLVAGGCAQKPTDPAALAEYEQTDDPLEPTNRFFFRVSDTLDAYTLKPVAQAYQWAVPLPARTGVHNALTNFGSPAVFVNDVLEAKPRRAGDTFVRFLVNSTIGVAGLFDVAKGLGYPAHDADAGLTFADWGIPSGPYLFLPVLGPSSPREATGFGVDVAFAPLTYVPRGYGLITLNWAIYGVGVVDSRSQVLGELDQIKRNALDPYATIRSLYRQHREAELATVRNDHRMTVPDWYSH